MGEDCPLWGPLLCLAAQSCLIPCDPVDCSPPGSSVHGASPGKSTGLGCHALLQGILLTQGIEPRSPTLQADSLPAELPGEYVHVCIYIKHICVCVCVIVYQNKAVFGELMSF